jgi:hypothetical protein
MHRESAGSRPEDICGGLPGAVQLDKIPFLSIIFVSCSDTIPFATLIRLGMIKIVII